MGESMRQIWVKVEEDVTVYPSSENKGADQLRSYCEADLRLCFRLCRLLVFPCGGSHIMVEIELLNFLLEFENKKNIS